MTILFIENDNIIAEFTPKSEDHYTVNCKIMENNETIFEVKTEYTKDEIEEQFKTNTHDNETSRLIFFNKDNYKDIYNYKQKKQYIPELWERIFE